MKTIRAGQHQPGHGTTQHTDPAQGARELPDALLDLVVGGAGDPPADLLARLAGAGIIPPGRLLQPKG